MNVTDKFDALQFELYKNLSKDSPVKLEYDTYWVWELRKVNTYYLGKALYAWDSYEHSLIQGDKQNKIILDK